MAVTQVEIARRVGLDVSSVNKILNKRKGPVFKQTTVKKVFKVARELGFDLGRLKHQHRRRDPRRSVDLPVEITIYLGDGRIFDRGKAVLRDVSLSGGFLSAVALPQQVIPAQPHTLGIRALEGPLKDLEIMGRPVRLREEGTGINLAIEYLPTEGAKLKQLRKIV